MKLIPMTDFVLEQLKWNQENKKIEKDHYFSALVTLERLEAYANFLKQPLELWMFVPIDKESNVLQDPEYYRYYNEFNKWTDSKFDGFFDDEQDFEDWKRECSNYNKAKERVLFEGFEYKSMNKELGFVMSGINIETIYPFPNNKGYKVEDLISLNLTLTQTAIKQIGL